MTLSISRTTVIILLVTIFVSVVTYSYYLVQDIEVAKSTVKKKQQELANVIRLKDTYLYKKSLSELKQADNQSQQAFTYSFFEQRVSKHFVTGRLRSLKPVTVKGDKGQEKKAMDVKISGAALIEALSFVKAVEAEGLKVTKLSLSMSAGSNLLDISMTVTL